MLGGRELSELPDAGGGLMTQSFISVVRSRLHSGQAVELHTDLVDQIAEEMTSRASSHKILNARPHLEAPGGSRFEVVEKGDKSSLEGHAGIVQGLSRLIRRPPRQMPL